MVKPLFNLGALGHTLGCTAVPFCATTVHTIEGDVQIEKGPLAAKTKTNTVLIIPCPALL